jgi:hypothetical protein
MADRLRNRAGVHDLGTEDCTLLDALGGGIDKPDPR